MKVRDALEKLDRYLNDAALMGMPWVRVIHGKGVGILKQAENVEMGHEATVSRIGDEQLFYLRSRGISEAEAAAMIVRGFIEPITKQLPREYAVELNRLIELEMEGSVG